MCYKSFIDYDYTPGLVMDCVSQPFVGDKSVMSTILSFIASRATDNLLRLAECLYIGGLKDFTGVDTMAGQ